jgi:hypothetical protein
MADHPPVSDDVLTRLRAVCARLPEVHEETAWVGIRWRVRTKTFAHVLTIAGGKPDAYAAAAGTDGPASVLTFRARGEELEMLRHAPKPFFKPVWFDDIVGLVIDDTTDWDEVAELLTESYCALAPQKLAALVDRPEA